MTTLIREPCPEAKKLSKSNVAMWTHYMQYKMISHPIQRTGPPSRPLPSLSWIPRPPNDDALKTVLNQGNFALVSADVDLMQSFL